MEINSLIYQIVRIGLLVLTTILLIWSLVVAIYLSRENENYENNHTFLLLANNLVLVLAGAYSSWCHERTYLIAYGVALITGHVFNPFSRLIVIVFVGMPALAFVQSELIRKGFHQPRPSTSSGFNEHLSTINIE